MTSRFAQIALACLLSTTLITGCTKAPETRPAAGDTVSPMVSCPKTWKAGAAVVLTCRLRVDGGDAKPTLLKTEDIPLERVPRASFTFMKGDEVLQILNDVRLTPDC